MNGEVRGRGTAGGNDRKDRCEGRRERGGREEAVGGEKSLREGRSEKG